MRVGLVTDVPDEAVMRGIEHVMQGNRQFHRAQVGAEMPAGLAYAFNQEMAQLAGQYRQLLRGQSPYIRWRLDTV